MKAAHLRISQDHRSPRAPEYLLTHAERIRLRKLTCTHHEIRMYARRSRFAHTVGGQDYSIALSLNSECQCEQEGA
eukprot:1675386-Pyramimonas_sp.AAC.1